MQSRSTTGVLVSIKVLLLIGSICCLVLHILQYTMGYNTPHITVFCGTYMGFTLVNLSFLISAMMGKPAAEELDMALGVIGGILFYTCGLLAMYFVRQNISRYPNDDRYFNMARCMAMASLLTALIFVFDACLKFDMWNYQRNKRKGKRTDEDDEPPPLRLFCLDICHFCYKKCRCCECCNECCDKYCKCCRPKEEDNRSRISASSKASQETKAPTIKVEKYPDNSNPKERSVVQRVEIDWDSGPFMYPKSMGDIRESRKGNDKFLSSEADTTSVSSSFFATQKLTWPLPCHSLVPSELSPSSRMQRVPKSSTMRQTDIPTTSNCSLQVISDTAVPPVSFEPNRINNLERTQSSSSSSSSLPLSGNLRQEEFTADKPTEDKFTSEGRSSEINSLKYSDASPSSPSKSSMIVRSRSTKRH